MKREKCTGCCACLSICPVNAISMDYDVYGNIYPNINEKLCIQCNQCKKVCPIINEPHYQPIQKCFAVYSKSEEDKNKCSSGGVCTAIGRYIIEAGGLVFGTLWDGNGYIFSMAETNEQMEKFRGSKYVYVCPQKIYADVEKKLSVGRLCLFIGTPCQIDGLLHYLGKSYDNLYTIDLICHGTPPEQYLAEYIKSITDEELSNVSFRGEIDFRLSLFCKNKLIYSKQQDEDDYFYSFLNGIIHRDICYECKYACPNRVSDFTAGDFWGLKEETLSNYKGKISCLLINSNKGIRLFDNVKERFVFEEREIGDALKGNAQLIRPSLRSELRDKFKECYINNDIRKCFDEIGVSKIVRNTQIRNTILYIPRKIKRWMRQ